MFKNIIVFVVFFLLVIACSSTDKPKKPNNLISENQMSEVLYDLYIINAAKGVNRKLLETNGFIPEAYVLTKYNIDSIQFVESNAYYAFDTDVYKVIVDRVKDRLEKEKEEFKELQKIEGQAAKRTRDSINKIKKRKKGSIKKQSKDSLFKVIDSTSIN